MIFIDMDGVLASYTGSFTQTEFEEGFFYNKKPILINIKAIFELFAGYPLAILSASPHEMGIKEKNGWLDIYCPIEERHFVKYPGECKAEFLIKYAEKQSLKREDILLIDDDLSILKKVQGAGFNVWHPSTILVAYEKQFPDITLSEKEYEELARDEDRYIQLLKRRLERPKQNRKIISSNFDKYTAD